MRIPGVSLNLVNLRKALTLCIQIYKTVDFVGAIYLLLYFIDINDLCAFSSHLIIILYRYG